MVYGDHIYVNRGIISHHGVAIRDGWVIHFASPNGSKSGAVIGWARIEDFAGSGEVQVRPYGERFSANEATARAESMLGRSGYDLFANNCEHFATWCVAGEHSSAQVEAATAGVSVIGIGAVVPSLGVGVVASLGEAAAMSGPNFMSGLASVGGSVVGGMVLLGGAAGLLAGGTTCSRFATSPCSPMKSARPDASGVTGPLAARPSASVWPSTRWASWESPGTALRGSPPGWPPLAE